MKPASAIPISLPIVVLSGLLAACSDSGSTGNGAGGSPPNNLTECEQTSAISHLSTAANQPPIARVVLQGLCEVSSGCVPSNGLPALDGGPADSVDAGVRCDSVWIVLRNAGPCIVSVWSTDGTFFQTTIMATFMSIDVQCRAGGGTYFMQSSQTDPAFTEIVFGPPPATDGGIAHMDAKGFGPAQVELSPSKLEFGAVLLGGAKTLEAFVTNTSSGMTGALSQSLGGAHPGDFEISSSDCQGTVLYGGMRCTVSITYSPTATGNRFGTFLVSANPGGGGSILLEGTAQAPDTL